MTAPSDRTVALERAREELRSQSSLADGRRFYISRDPHAALFGISFLDLYMESHQVDENSLHDRVPRTISVRTYAISDHRPEMDFLHFSEYWISQNSVEAAADPGSTLRALEDSFGSSRLDLESFNIGDHTYRGHSRHVRDTHFCRFVIGDRDLVITAAGDPKLVRAGFTENPSPGTAM